MPVRLETITGKANLKLLLPENYIITAKANFKLYQPITKKYYICRAKSNLGL